MSDDIFIDTILEAQAIIARHRRRTCFGRGDDRQADAIARWHRIGEGACQKGIFEPSVRVRRTRIQKS
jgi:hypothetical protein